MSGSTPSSTAGVQVSVVISTLDRPRQLGRCLDALLAGSRRPDEVVVVDQGDPARTAAVLADRAGALELVHVPQPRLGLSASQNAAVARARYPVVAIVDDDCVPDERWLEVAARAHEAEGGRPLLLTGRVLPLPSDGERTVPLSSRPSTTPLTLGRDAMPWDVGTGGNFSMTRSLYLHVGGNDERLGTGTPGRAGNDLDLFHRVQQSGARVRFDPDLLVLHERATPDEYRARRWNYGFGVGACVAAWWRQGDRSAWRVLAHWLLMRGRLAAAGHGRASIANETRVLGGTVHGLWYGWRVLAEERTPATLDGARPEPAEVP